VSESPLLVGLIPVACASTVGPGLAARTELLPALWAPDPVGTGGFLFLRSDELMPFQQGGLAAGGSVSPVDMQQENQRIAGRVLRGSTLSAALVSNPSLSLNAYNSNPTITDAQFGAVLLRTAVDLSDGDHVDTHLTTAPFTALDDGVSAAHLGAVLGTVNCAALLAEAALPLRAYLRTADGIARCSRVFAHITTIPASDVAPADSQVAQILRFHCVL